MKTANRLIKSIPVGLITMLLRMATLGGKFVLLIILSRYLPVEDVGAYGLMVSITALAQFAFGYELYHYTTREIVTATPVNQVRMIKWQGLCHLFAVMVFAPFFLLCFALGFAPWQYLGWFIALAILELLAQETYRFLICSKKPLSAAIALFIRGGLWSYIVAALFLAGVITPSIEYVWIAWISGVLLSISFAFFGFRKLPWAKGKIAPIDRLWIKNGAKTSSFFFLSGICTLLIQNADIFILNKLHGLSDVGVYVFFATLAKSIQSLVYSATTMIYLPDLTRSYKEGNMVEYQIFKKRHSKSVIIISIAVSIVAVAAINPLLWLTGKDDYIKNIHLFWLLVPAVAMYSISDIPHLSLYVAGKDKLLLLSTAITLIFCIVLDIILIHLFSFTGAAIALLSSFIFMFLFKYYLSKKPI